MKKIKEYLNELPEPIRSEAISNTPVDVLELHHISLSDSISAAFIWKESIQGHEYWYHIHDECMLNDAINQFDDNHHEEQQWEADQENNNKSQFED